MTRLTDLVETARAVAATPRRLEKIAILSKQLRGMNPEVRPTGLSYLAGALPQGRIGLGPATVRAVRGTPACPAPELTVAETDRCFEQIGHVNGKGSTSARQRLLGELFARATGAEQEFLARLILGELRQGALAGVMVDAVADAARVPVEQVRRAAMLAGDLVEVAGIALTEGSPGLLRYRLHLFTPLQPMLAQPAEDPALALRSLGEAALEYKLDGVRVQVHKSGNQVRVYTRQLNDITDRVPELVERVRGYWAHQLILDGEALAFRDDGRPHRFQVSMRRLGRRLDVARARSELPLQALYFDCLHLDGTDLLDREARDRFDILARTLPEIDLIPRTVTSDVSAAEQFLSDAIERGHEGIMAKSVLAPYAAGSRGADWLKIKPAQTLDLVVLAAEWGSGRRTGFLSNLHLGARSAADDSFVMLGKTFKGLTDRMLEWQTKRLLELEIDREDHIVYVRPEIVVEITFNELQSSAQYPGGLALRFARVKRYRTDKKPTDADTMETVWGLFRG